MIVRDSNQLNLKRAGSLSLVDMEHVGAEHMCVCDGGVLKTWNAAVLTLLPLYFSGST